jgi:hypothetical protein
VNKSNHPILNALLLVTEPRTRDKIFTLILFNSVTASRVQFRAGSSRRGTGGSLHPASELIANPDYDYYTVDFDVAVARASEFNLFLHFSENIH